MKLTSDQIQFNVKRSKKKVGTEKEGDLETIYILNDWNGSLNGYCIFKNKIRYFEVGQTNIHEYKYVYNIYKLTLRQKFKIWI